MDIRERVINGVDHCSQNGFNCDGCEYKGIQDCVTRLMQDLRDVLHEIEAKQQTEETKQNIVQIVIAALEKGGRRIMIESHNGEVTLTITPWQKCE